MRKVVSGGTTIYASLLSLRHVPPILHIEYRDGHIMSLTISQAILDEAIRNDLLGEDIGLEGLATWDISDWTLVSFRVTRLTRYRPGQPEIPEAIRQLAETSKGRWIWG